MSKRHQAGRASRWLLAGMIAGCAAWLSTSCGGTSRAGTDSQTHWLGHCESDSDCGVAQLPVWRLHRPLRGHYGLQRLWCASTLWRARALWLGR